MNFTNIICMKSPWNSEDIEYSPQVNKMDTSKPKLKVADSEGRIEENDDLETKKETNSNNDMYFATILHENMESKSKLIEIYTI